MPVQLNIFLLLFGGLQGLLFTLFLVRRKLHRSGYAFLLAYFGVLLLQIVLKVMSKSWLMHNWWELYQVSYQLPLLYGPLIYLFARQITARRRIQAIDLLHFAPFVLSFIWIVSGGVLGVLFNGPVSLAIQLVSVGAYHILAYKCWQLHHQNIKKVFSNVEQLQLKWLRTFILISGFVCATVAITIYLMYIYFPALNWMRIGFVALTLFIYWVSYSALTQPDIFSVVQGGKLQSDGPDQAIVTELTPILKVHRPAKKYSNSVLTEEESVRIATALEELMTTERPYLDPELTIDKLAASVSCTRHNLSQVLNQKIGLSFYDYINTYRINEARALLANPALADHKIAAIAYDAGFNSLSAFNDVFKKATGQTPSRYRKQPVEKIEQKAG